MLKQRATEIRCLGNLRRIGMASMLYAADNQMQLPATMHQRRMGLKSWTLSLQPYTNETIEFRCPAEPAGGRAYTYLLNDYLTANPSGAPELDFSRLDRLDEPARTLMFAEASPGYTGSDHFHFSDYYGGRMPIHAFERQVETKRHDGAAHYLFADGHAEPLRHHEVEQRLQRRPSRFLQPAD